MQYDCDHYCSDCRGCHTLRLLLGSNSPVLLSHIEVLDILHPNMISFNWASPFNMYCVIMKNARLMITHDLLIKNVMNATRNQMMTEINMTKGWHTMVGSPGSALHISSCSYLSHASSFVKGLHIHLGILVASTNNRLQECQSAASMLSDCIVIHQTSHRFCIQHLDGVNLMRRPELIMEVEYWHSTS